jgi:hypothetical protein
MVGNQKPQIYQTIMKTKKTQIKSVCLVALASLTLSGFSQTNTFPANGNVGIGTVAPPNKLTVIGGGGGSIDFRVNGRIQTGDGSNYGGMWCNGATTQFMGQIDAARLGMWNNGAWRLAVDNLGNVGVGTLTPTNRLTIIGGGGGNIDLKVNGRLQSGDASNAGGMWCNGALTQFVGQIDATRLGMWNNGAWRFAVDNAGNIGVGTLTPTNRLTVFGGGNYNVDLRVNGRLQTGDASNYGGIWCNAAGTQFVGQVDATRLGLWNNGFALVVHNDGKVLIGNATTPAGYKLYVETGILTEKLKAALKTSSQWADHVFSPSYKLKSLEEVEAFVKANKHLEGIPSADELVKEGGIDMNVMFAKQMEKIEELTLYVIEMKKEIESIKSENSELKSRTTNK